MGKPPTLKDLRTGILLIAPRIFEYIRTNYPKEITYKRQIARAIAFISQKGVNIKIYCDQKEESAVYSLNVTSDLWKQNKLITLMYNESGEPIATAEDWLHESPLRVHWENLDRIYKALMAVANEYGIKLP